MYEKAYQPRESYIRVATACPEVHVADVDKNLQTIGQLYLSATEQDVSLLAFPEMSLTGYTVGDLVQQTTLLNQAETGVAQLAELTRDKNTAMVVGLPIRFGNALYNSAALLAEGQVKGVIPKINLPTYDEFYEDRWFKTWDGPDTTVKINGQEVPFGNNILFDIAGTKVGIEICEDLWVAQSPSIRLTEQGAQIIVNPSASPEQVGKAERRKQLVAIQSGKLFSGYLYAGSDVSESTAEIVMGGHQIIALDGQILAERIPFGQAELTITDLDIDHIEADRRRHHVATHLGSLVVQTSIVRSQEDLLTRVERNPFLPNESADRRQERLQSAIAIQANGLARRMRATYQEKVILGLSGGLDSTLALLVALEAAKILHKQPGSMIETLTMPGFASSDMTQHNAQTLANSLGVPNRVFPINELAEAELKLLEHSGEQDITYENVQARARTSLLFNYANLHGGMVLGTGDLSEIALGWSTYNADQQSHYNVNASIPKTMVKHLVAYLAEQPDYLVARQTLAAIIETPISPELTSHHDDKISQTTEDIIGPYELHDFFLYSLIRWGDTRSKIEYLANQAFADVYQPAEINKWLGVFLNRFARSQFKRETMPNGPKVGSVSLSPRGDWRMPSDLHNAALWE